MAPRGLGPREREIMDVLWDADAALPVRSVRERLTAAELSYTTVMTILDNLHRKGLVTRERRGRGYDYRPAIEPAEFAAGAMAAALSGTADRPGALVRFVDTISRDDVDLLRAIVGDADRARTRKSD